MREKVHDTARWRVSGNEICVLIFLEGEKIQVLNTKDGRHE